MTGLPGVSGDRLRDFAPLSREPVRRALAALNGGGAETRVVGGAVRDLALGIEPGDFDLATTLAPEETMNRARAAGFKVVPTGLAHGTVTLVLEGRGLEVTTLREDVETDGRHAKVVFGRDFIADARRRDFTINALSLDTGARIHDPLGGLADLAAGRVRFIGEAAARIREDYLRILRFFRFSARFGVGALDPEGLDACVRLRAQLDRLSRERVRAEVLKLLAARRAGSVARAMSERGLWGEIVGFADPARLERVIAIEDFERSAPDALLRLAGLTTRIPEDAERVADRLRLSNAERARLAAATATLAWLHGTPAAPAADALTRLLFFYGARAATDALVLAQVESGAPADDAGFAAARRFLHEASAPKSPIRGRDIVARGVTAGPRVSAILQAFLDRWVEAGFPSNPDAVESLLAAAEAAIPPAPL
jgi:tRNA nucleotidyltransferase/poly(A) polymerase